MIIEAKNNLEFISLIENRLENLGVPKTVLLAYEEKHRFYHNLDHIVTMINSALIQDILTDDLLLAIVFHDIVYEPRLDNNEEKSAELFKTYIDNPQVVQAILETKTHKPTTELSKNLCDLDLEVLKYDFSSIVKFEMGIFKEYQFVDFPKYKSARLKILSQLDATLEHLTYLRYFNPSIAVYAGSFNPFHIGHLNILEKAEKIFDKVIIARGMNWDKKNEHWEFPNIIEYRQFEMYDGLLTDFIEKLDYDVTLVRGLRNSNDFQYELTQYRYLQDLYPQINVVSIFCDKEFEHVSSSAIRQLARYGADGKYLL